MLEKSAIKWQPVTEDVYHLAGSDMLVVLDGKIVCTDEITPDGWLLKMGRQIVPIEFARVTHIADMPFLPGTPTVFPIALPAADNTVSRELGAYMALQGLLVNNAHYGGPERYAREAIRYSDELHQQLSQE